MFDLKDKKDLKTDTDTAVFPPPDYRYKSESGRIRIGEGGDTLAYSVRVPLFSFSAEASETAEGAVNSFYEELFSAALDYCTHRLPTLWEDKREERGSGGTVRLVYTFSSSVSFADGKYLSVLSEAELSEAVLRRGGGWEKRILSSYRRGHIFSLSDGLLIPPRGAWKKLGLEKVRPSRKGSLIISSGRLVRV